jgi:hypothetical protein
LRPYRHHQRNRQHRKTDDHEAWDRDDEIADETAQKVEILASQWKAPLEQKETENDKAEQGIADRIEQRNDFHPFVC